MKNEDRTMILELKMAIKRGTTSFGNTYTTGEPATAVYSTAPQFLHPTTNANTTTHNIYAKLVYSVHSATLLLECWFKVSSCNCAFVIFS